MQHRRNLRMDGLEEENGTAGAADDHVSAYGSRARERVGWSLHKIARERDVGLGTVHRAAHKYAESNASIRAVPAPDTRRAKPARSVDVAGGWGVDASSRRDSASGVSCLPLKAKGGIECRNRRCGIGLSWVRAQLMSPVRVAHPLVRDKGVAPGV